MTDITKGPIAKNAGINLLGHTFKNYVSALLKFIMIMTVPLSPLVVVSPIILVLAKSVSESKRISWVSPTASSTNIRKQIQNANIRCFI